MAHRTDCPLRIAEIAVGLAGGRIGITISPGKQQRRGLSGRQDRDLGADLDVIAKWNAAAVVTLVETEELKALKIPSLGHEVRRRFMEWHHYPIEDGGIPGPEFETAWPHVSLRLRTLLDNGCRILIHCKGGLGRAGTIAARLLVETGKTPGDAIKTVRDVRPGAIENPAQEGWVGAGEMVSLPTADRTMDATADRAVGSLVGLAVGDAVGTRLEFEAKPATAILADMVGGGPFGLQAGQWSDDTAMALALADSLLHDADLNPTDLMTRFVDWHENGTYSCTGSCFDIGNTTQDALDRFHETGEALAGSTDPLAAGNGALMRLAPVAIRHWHDRGRLRDVAIWQTRTTHGATEAIEASVTFAEMLADAIAGEPLTAVLTSPAAGRIKGGWRGLHRDQIRGTGYAVEALQAAVWAVSRTTCFRSAILLAANLGEDADTTAAIAGQLAGAVYGKSRIPQDWLSRLAWADRIETSAKQLFAGGWRQRAEGRRGHLAWEADDVLIER